MRGSHATAKLEIEESKVNYSAGSPRTLAELAALGDDLLNAGDCAASRDEAELKSAEWFEREGKLMFLVEKKVIALQFAAAKKTAKRFSGGVERVRTGVPASS